MKKISTITAMLTMFLMMSVITNAQFSSHGNKGNTTQYGKNSQYGQTSQNNQYGQSASYGNGNSYNQSYDAGDRGSRINDGRVDRDNRGRADDRDYDRFNRRHEDYRYDWRDRGNDHRYFERHDEHRF